MITFLYIHDDNLVFFSRSLLPFPMLTMTSVSLLAVLVGKTEQNYRLYGFIFAVVQCQWHYVLRQPSVATWHSYCYATVAATVAAAPAAVVAGSIKLFEETNERRERYEV